MAKKLILGLILACFGPNLAPNFFSRVLLLPDIIHFWKLSLYTISRKASEANLRKWPQTQFWAQFWPKFSLPSQFSFLWSFATARCYELLKAGVVCNFKENYKIKLEKMAKQVVLGPILDPLAEICAPHPPPQFTSTRCQTLLQVVIVCNFKES